MTASEARRGRPALRATVHPAPDLDPAAAARWPRGCVHSIAKCTTLLDRGASLQGISRQLGLARGTVRRLAGAGTAEALLAGGRLPSGPRLLDPGCRAPAAALGRRGHQRRRPVHRDPSALGYRGYNTVQHHVRPWRTGQPPTTPPARPLTARDIAGCAARDPDTLDADDQTAAPVSATTARS
jgi:hypothetical protein